jgi:CubicO group peptidase (beta-lactamase class C family)
VAACGALLIIHRGEPVFREGFGVASLENGKPFTIDAPSRIASVTKPHTSTLIAMLVEQGKLAWDDPVDKYLPTFAGIAVRDKGPATRTPKIRELLSHTAGFPGQPAIDSGRWKIKTTCTLATSRWTCLTDARVSG